MATSICAFMETVCLKSIKKPLRTSVIAEAVLSEPFFMPVMTVKTYSQFPVAVGTGIVPHVNRIKQINGCISK